MISCNTSVFREGTTRLFARLRSCTAPRFGNNCPRTVSYCGTGERWHVAHATLQRVYDHVVGSPTVQARRDQLRRRYSYQI
jgi:hypothetical protein